MKEPLVLKPCRVVCAGLIRSGSTWQYNAARFLLWPLHQGRSYVSDYAHYNRQHEAPVHFIKEHQWRQDLSERADVILTSFRAVEDVKASWLRYKGTELAAADIGGHLVHLRKYLSVAHSVMNYDDLVQDEMAVIGRLAYDLRRVLGTEAVTSNMFHVKHQLHAIEYPTPGEPHHPVALYRSNHRTNL